MDKQAIKKWQKTRTECECYQAGPYLARCSVSLGLCEEGRCFRESIKREIQEELKKEYARRCDFHSEPD